LHTGQKVETWGSGTSLPSVVDHPQGLDSPVSSVQDTNQQDTNQGGSNSTLVLTIGGSAIATGANTLADGTIHSTAQDLGPIREATGYASFVAAASSQPGNPTTADAVTFANVSGADFVFEATMQSGPAVGSGGSVISTSQTDVVAIDIPGWNPPNGPVELDVTIREPSLTQTLGNPNGNGDVAVLGHLATIAANANALGPNSLAETQTFALTDGLTGDNAFSFVSGSSISGIA
jgi:hypothetical protein